MLLGKNNRIYDKLPIFIQNTGISIFKINVFFERKLSPFFHNYYHSILKSQWCDEKELKKIQEKSLRNLVKYSYENVPYYHKTFKSLNLYPEDIKKKDDLEKIPIINKEIVRKHWSEFISKEVNRINSIKVTTNGSTGKPLDIIWSKKSLTIGRCFGYRLRTWAGVYMNSNLAHFGGMDFLFNENNDKPPFWRVSYPEKIIYFLRSFIQGVAI